MNKIMCKYHGHDCRYTEIKNDVDFSLIWDNAEDEEEQNDIAKTVAKMFKNGRSAIAFEEENIYIFEASEKRKLLDFFIAKYPQYFVV